ncbi:MAG: hypothetical protein SPI12_02960 [Actinomycetaceae bacterium]|nr:hypothetical protein [Actinomycetaceae bacterium]MDY6082809.1 hypothetical protein [Actinomycetaceae bacterium]
MHAPQPSSTRTWRATARSLLFPQWCYGCLQPDTVLCSECSHALAGSWENVTDRLPYLNIIQPDETSIAMMPVFSLGAYSGIRRHIIISWKHTLDRDLDAAIRRVILASWASLRQLIVPEHPLTDAPSLVFIPAPSRFRRFHDGRFVAGKLATSFALAALSEHIPAGVWDPLSSGWALRRGSTVSGRREKTSHITMAPWRTAARELGGLRWFVAPTNGGSTLFILVDDVVTSGATLAACSRALALHGIHVHAALTLAAAKNPRQIPAHNQSVSRKTPTTQTIAKEMTIRDRPQTSHL